MKSKDVLPAIKAPSDILIFGKYRGRTVELVLAIDPGYIEWLVDENICAVSDEIYQTAQIYLSLDREYSTDEMPRTYGDLDE